MNSSDRPTIPRRRLALFLLAFLVPFAALTILAVRTLNQDRELRVRRAEDERRQVATAIRQELLARLERLKFLALSGAAETSGHDAIVLVAPLEDGRLVLPWEDGTAAEARRLLAEPTFAARISSGETEELVRLRPASAVSLYQRALSSARHPVQAASAELLVARALAKAGRHAEALAYSRRTLARPLSVIDDLAVPFALYASRRVSDLDGVDGDDAAAALEPARQAGHAPSLSPAAIQMAAVVLSTLRSKGPPAIQALASDAEPAVAAQISRREQTLALQQTFPALARQFPATASEPFWLPFGQEPWLIGLTADVSNRPLKLIAVDASTAFEGLESAARCAAGGGCRLAVASGAGSDGYPLGPALPGLTLLDVTSPGADGTDDWTLQQVFYVAALSLVLAVAMFGAYLLWRDVRRELRVAELRSQFVSSVSHELKTPLTAVRMFAETLRMGRPADPALRNEYLDTIVNESERLTRLLNNVLDFSRIESGRKVYQFAPHDLVTIVRTAARAMQYPLAQQGFDLQVDVVAGIPPVPVDADALEQAILNLLANALKYSGDARRIELRLARDEVHAVISVRDWGIGIERVDQQRIFDKFFRVARPENRLIPGTGLGLTLVDHIVRAHHGRVDVESASGGGSTFRIHLPLARENPTSSAEAAEPASRRAAESQA